jgi:hypothetical protein
MMAWSDPEFDPAPRGDRQRADARWDELFAHVMWMEPKPRWRPRWGQAGGGGGGGGRLAVAVAVAVSCVLWAAVLVPLILWWPW